jgi:CubicO group peptidase (beta-lactamase class C family)
VGGTCDPRFEAVREAFEANIAAGLEAGASCAVVVNGSRVVDVWGGVADTATGTPWEANTLVDCRSATKGLTALCLFLLVDRALVDLDAPLRRYWPELRVDPTVRQALSHQAGVPVIDDLPRGAILDWEVMAEAVARQEPMWTPGERHGYHGASFGWLVGEPVRRLTRESLQAFLKREVLDSLDLDGFMGTPADHHGRLATLIWGLPSHGETPMPQGVTAGTPPTLAQRMYAPVLPPLAPGMNDPAFRSAPIPVTGAAVTASVFAEIFGQLALGGGSLVSRSAATEMGSLEVEGEDAVLGIPVRRSAGYEMTPTWADDGRPSSCFGSPGGGGVVTFADPEAEIGFAYLNNASWSGPPGPDPRAASITRALYSCL